MARCRAAREREDPAWRLWEAGEQARALRGLSAKDVEAAKAARAPGRKGGVEPESRQVETPEVAVEWECGIGSGIVRFARIANATQQAKARAAVRARQEPRPDPDASRANGARERRAWGRAVGGLDLARAAPGWVWACREGRAPVRWAGRSRSR